MLIKAKAVRIKQVLAKVSLLSSQALMRYQRVEFEVNLRNAGLEPVQSASNVSLKQAGTWRDASKRLDQGATTTVDMPAAQSRQSTLVAPEERVNVLP